MSVYRRNGRAEAIIYEKLLEILVKVKEMYRDAKIIIGGDFNDASPPKNLEDLDLYSPKSYSRFNILERKNTTIDQFFSNSPIQIRTMTITKPHDDLSTGGQSFRSKV